MTYFELAGQIYDLQNCVVVNCDLWSTRNNVALQRPFRLQWQAMQPLANLTAEDTKGLVHHDVVDEKDHKVGSVHSFRVKEENGKPEFVVISSGWLFGHLFLAPASIVEISPDRKRLKLPFERHFIEAAPTLHSSKIVTFTDTTLSRRYFLGETPQFRPEDLDGDRFHVRRPPGYDPNDTGITKI